MRGFLTWIRLHWGQFFHVARLDAYPCHKQWVMDSSGVEKHGMIKMSVLKCEVS